jgi:hypothetical protein
VRTALQQLEAVLQLLDARGWRRVREARRFWLYASPGDVGPKNFQLAVPRNTDAPDFSKAVANCIDAIASFYEAPFSSIEALLLPQSEVVSMRLQGEGFVGGAAPFSQFERTIEHLKRTISRAASFVLTDDPLAQRIPLPARHFVDECWFLQTARGSFVARVALPTGGGFGGIQYGLFGRLPAKADVASTLRGVSEFVGQRVLTGDDVFTAEGVDEVRRSASVALLEEFGKLLRGPQAESIDLAFARHGEEAVVRIPELSEARLARLDAFVAFVRERLHAVFDLDVTGRVFEVRRSRRSSQSFVGLETAIDGHPEYVTFKIEPASLPVILEHFRSRVPIRVRGKARRLRTQIRIESDFQYVE